MEEVALLGFALAPQVEPERFPLRVGEEGVAAPFARAGTRRPAARRRRRGRSGRRAVRTGWQFAPVPRRGRSRARKRIASTVSASCSAPGASSAGSAEVGSAVEIAAAARSSLRHAGPAGGRRPRRAAAAPPSSPRAGPSSSASSRRPARGRRFDPCDVAGDSSWRSPPERQRGGGGPQASAAQRPLEPVDLSPGRSRGPAQEAQQIARPPAAGLGLAAGRSGCRRPRLPAAGSSASSADAMP